MRVSNVNKNSKNYKILLLFIFSVILLVNIQTAKAYCGDNYCDEPSGEEDCTLCPADCGACPLPPSDGGDSATKPTSGGQIIIKMDLPDELNDFYLTSGSDCGISATEEDIGWDDRCDARVKTGYIIKRTGRLSDAVEPYYGYYGGCDDDAKVVIRRGFGEKTNTNSCFSSGGNCQLNIGGKGDQSTYGPKGEILCGSDGQWYLCDSAFQDKTFPDGDKYYKCASGAWQETGAPTPQPTQTCGNGVKEGSEECDGTDKGTPEKTCQDKGFTGGTLGCYPTTDATRKCTFDTSGCTTTPGGLTATPSSIRIRVRETGALSEISGGTTPYSIKTPPNSLKATASLSGAILTVTGVAQGTTSVVVKDLSSPEKTVTIPINVMAQSPTLCTWLSPAPCIVSGFGPYGDTLPSDDAKAWYISHCLQPTKDNMAQFKSYYDAAFGTNLERYSSTSDKIKFPNAGWRDLLRTSNCWVFDLTPDLCASNSDCLSGSSCDGKYCSCTSNSNCKSGLVCTSGKCMVSGTEVPPPPPPSGDCNDPSGTIPQISSAAPTTAKKSEQIKIIGNDLTNTAKFYSGTAEYAAVGSVTLDCTETKITVPNNLPSGRYTLKIYKAKGKISNGVEVTIRGNVPACNPDGDMCDYCDEISQCLVNPLAAENQCIRSGEYSGDDYCESGKWSSRTKLLALKLLKLKTGDYTLFCDTKENTLNNIQYLTDSGQAASSILTSLQTNNFCILKTADKIVLATSVNKNPETVPGGFNVLGVTKCDAARDDNNYYQCDSSKGVWYNKKLKSFIYSATPITVTSEQEPSSTISGIIKAIIDSIKRLITNPPYDESYVRGIKKFNKLYLSQQGTKSIMGALEGKNLKNAVVQYNSFDVDVCSYTNQYNSQKGATLAGIVCKKEGNNYYVLVQGNQMTGLDPESIWPDLTAKIRLK